MSKKATAAVVGETVGYEVVDAPATPGWMTAAVTVADEVAVALIPSESASSQTFFLQNQSKL